MSGLTSSPVCVNSFSNLLGLCSLSKELFFAEAFLIIGIFVMIRSQKQGFGNYFLSQRGYSLTFGAVAFVIAVNNLIFEYDSFFLTNELSFSLNAEFSRNGIEYFMFFFLFTFGRLIPRLLFGAMPPADYGPALTNVILWSSFLIVAYCWTILFSIITMGEFVPGDWIMTYYSTIDWISLFIWIPLGLTFILPNRYT